MITESRKKPKVYFEGNFNSYTYSEEGTSLYDVLNLYNDNRHLIRDPLLKNLKNTSELKQYIEKTGDKQLSMMLDLVEEYGSRIHDLISSIKDCLAVDRQEADCIFSTVHRCKGLEYDEVELVNDFISEEKLRKLIEVQAEDESLIEEINLLYVAITRTRYHLIIDPELLPNGFVPSEGIKVNLIKPKPQDLNMGGMRPLSQNKNLKFLSKSNWSHDDDDELSILYADGYSIADIAERMGRSKGFVWSKIKKLQLDEDW